MTRLLTRFLATVIAFAVLFSIASARKKTAFDFKWEEITDNDWNVSEDSVKEYYDAIMIFEKIDADDTNMGNDKCYRTVYRRVRILSEDGRDEADVAIPFYDSDQKIEGIKARTVLRDGTIIELSEDNIFEKEIVKTRKDKYKQTSFSIPGVTDDCIIEYVYKVRIDFSRGDWIVQKDIALLYGRYSWKFFVGDGSRSLARAMVHLDMGTPNYLWLNCGPTTSVKHLPNLKESTEMLFEITDVPPYDDEPYSMPDASLRAKLLCYYSTDGSPASYWGDRADGLKNWITKYCEDDKKVKEIVASFGELATEDEKIEKAYNWVRDSLVNITYDDYYDKNGKKKEPKDNESIDDVIKHGYGNIIDLNVVFYDMLREMNIDAKFAYSMDRLNDIFVYEMKSAFQFTGTFVAVENGDNTYDFYSPGQKYTTLGMVPWYYEGVNALIIGGRENFSSIPFTSASVNGVNRSYNYEINDDLEIYGSMFERHTGQSAWDIRMDLDGEDSSQYRSILEDDIKENFANATIDSVTVENVEDYNEPLKIKCTLEFPDIDEQADKILLRPFDYFVSSDNPFFKQERNKAILFDYSFQYREGGQFLIPEGWQVEALPTDTVFQNIAGQCSIQFVNFGNTLSVQRFFTVNSPFWLVDQYSLIKEVFQTRKDFNDLVVVLSRVE